MSEPVPYYDERRRSGYEAGAAIDQALIAHWRTIHREAVQMAVMAEKNLIALGAMKPTDRQVMTRKTKRARRGE